MGLSRDAITLHIEELVLTGFAPGSKHAIGETVQTELARLLSEGGIGDAVARGSQGKLEGGMFRLPARPNALTSGSGIAHQVYAVLHQRGGKNG